MKHTGVFATKDELDELRKLVGLPAIKIGNYIPKTPQQVCHDIALRHGLPEITGYYGINGDGEFLQE